MLNSKLLFRLNGLIVVCSLGLSACNLPQSAATGQPNLIATAAEETVVAQLTTVPINQPTSGNISPTDTSAGPVVTATGQPSQTSSQIPQAPTATVQPTPGPTTITEPLCDRAEFVQDVTISDGSNLAPGAIFVKTWRLKNNGTCTWKSDYALVFFDKNAMSGPSAVAFTNNVVAPGTTVDVSVTLKAPSTPGSYEGDWKLRNSAGQTFGIGNNASDYFWVKVNVVNGTRVSMLTGRTTATVDGHVDKNSRTTFLAGARANQYMMAMINNINKPLAIEIQAPDGSYLAKASDNNYSWQGTLPVDGDYLVTVVNSGDATDFNISITIPVRVTFLAGATSASLNGVEGAHEVNTYLLRAQKDQQMTVNLTSDHGDILLAIYGLQDGQPYLRYQLGQTSFTFKLPTTQDYVIQCFSFGSSVENYTISFVVK